LIIWCTPSFTSYDRYLNVNGPEFIKPQNLPPNSPTWTQLIYFNLGCSSTTCVLRNDNVAHLKQVIICCWAELSQELIDGAIRRGGNVSLQFSELEVDISNIDLLSLTSYGNLFLIYILELLICFVTYFVL
jgi:hypothetical protein